MRFNMHVCVYIYIYVLTFLIAIHVTHMKCDDKCGHTNAVILLAIT